MAEASSISTPAQQPARSRWVRLVTQAEVPLIWVLALAGVALVLINTRWGAYLSDDTYYYIYPARDFLAGKGFQPSYIFAPLLPAVLALTGLLGVEPIVSVRWLNALLFGVNLLLAARLVRQITRAPGFPLIAVSLLLLSDVVIEAHGWAMSEALAFTWMLASLSSTLAYIQSRRRMYWWLAAAFSALTLLTRYAALPLVAAIGIVLLAFSPAGGSENNPSKKFLRRLIDAFLYGILSLLPLAAYWLRNQLVSGHPVRYQQFLDVPFDRSQLVWFFYNWYSLFVPGRLLRGREILAGAALTLLAALLAAGLTWRFRKAIAASEGSPALAGASLCLAFLALNLLMLYLARGLTQLDVFNPRYLVPMLMVAIILLVSLAGQLWLASGRSTHWAILGLLGIFLIYYTYRAYDFTRMASRMGLGYSNAGWHDSETVAYLRQHPELNQMVSTGEMGIYFWTGRKPTVLADFSSTAKLKEYLCQTGAPLFLMDQMPAEIYGMRHDQIAGELTLLKKFNDGEMYGCPEK